jgi:hypothetical protein
MTAGSYTKQNILKCVASLLPALFNVEFAPYSEKLHDYLEHKQAQGSFGDALARFGLATWDDVSRLVRRLHVPLRMTVAVDADIVNVGAESSWGTALVHQCEVRQLLQTVPLAIIDRVLAAPLAKYNTAVQR